MTEEERKQLKIYYFQRRLIASQTYGIELIEKIKSAFSANKYPGDENLVATSEHRAECEECREIYEAIVGKTWQDCLDEKYYGKLCAGDSFFKPFAWHYYLPAYLIQSTERGKFSAFNFRPPDETEFEDEEFVKFWKDWEQKRIDLLSAAQCQVIVDYLELTLEVWKGLENGFEDDTKPLNFWKENCQNLYQRNKT